MAWEGAFAVVPQSVTAATVSPEFPVFTIDQRLTLPKWIELYFKVSAHCQAISGGSIGTNVRRRRLYPKDLLANKIPLPPLTEQRRIVMRVEELAQRLRKQRSGIHYRRSRYKPLTQASLPKFLMLY